MDFCGMCGMARTGENAIHLCTAEVVGILNQVARASA